MNDGTSKTPTDRNPDAPFVILDSPTQAEPELVCPKCDYSLAGLTEDRCPECGQPFDRAELIRWTTTPNLPLPLGRPGPLPFRERIFYLSIFAPARLGRGLPPLANEAASRDFSIWLRCGVGAASFLIVTMMWGEPGPAVGLVVGVVLAAVSITCEAVLAGILTMLVQPRGVPGRSRRAFWGVLCRCFAGHLLVTVGGMAAFTLAAAATGWESYTPLLGLFGVPVLTTLYWSFCVGRAVRARGIKSPGRTLAILLIPVCGAGAIILFVLLMTIMPSMLRGF